MSFMKFLRTTFLQYTSGLLSLGYILALSFAENILSMKLGFKSFIVLNVSKAKFLSLFISISFLFPVFGLVSAVSDSR